MQQAMNYRLAILAVVLTGALGGAAGLTFSVFRSSAPEAPTDPGLAYVLCPVIKLAVAGMCLAIVAVGLCAVVRMLLDRRGGRWHAVSHDHDSRQ